MRLSDRKNGECAAPVAHEKRRLSPVRAGSHEYKERASTEGMFSKQASERAPAHYSVDQLGLLHRTVGNRATARLLQMKLKIGAPDDSYEQEADRIADHVTRTLEPQLQQATSRWEEDVTVRRQPEGEDTELDEDTIQAKGRADETSEIDGALEARIEALRTGGQPLPETERAYFESRLGHDFGEVRIHCDPDAARVAQSLKARAFTLGRDVVFGPQEYAPGTSNGRWLMAHELSHVVQQGVGQARKVQKKAAGSTYVVKPGESLRKLAARFNVTQAELVEVNADKVQTWRTSSGKITKGFNTGETIIVPASGEAAKGEVPEEGLLGQVGRLGSAAGAVVKDFLDWITTPGSQEPETEAGKSQKGSESGTTFISVKEGVVLTPQLREATGVLEGYFAAANLQVVLTSGVRTTEKQLSIIRNYAKKNGLDAKYPSILSATVEDMESWRACWDELLNVKKVVVNPPVPAVAKLGSHGARTIGLSPHQKAAAIDLAGAPLDKIEAVVNKCKAEGWPVGQVLPEPKNGCVHVGIKI